jgi:hypothetical protein
MPNSGHSTGGPSFYSTKWLVLDEYCILQEPSRGVDDGRISLRLPTGVDIFSVHSVHAGSGLTPAS